ncbi:MAG: M28 family peptidase, partial [Candidatus Thorarchaeota archaeon]
MIDEKRIKNNLMEFSFPRLSGTSNEKKAFQIALKKLEELNLKPIIQEFEFSTFFARTYPKLVFLFGYLLLVFNFLNISTPFIPIISIILFSFLLVLIVLMRKPENVRFPKRLNSANLYVKLHSDQAKNTLDSINRKRIIFFSHLDSKGQRFSILARVRAIRAWVFSSLISCIIIILKNFVFPVFSLAFLIVGSFSLLITTISTIMILLNSTNNLSHGVIDNATGIACVFELLKHYLDSQLLNYDLWFVFTGCEECGTMGIRNFYNVMENFN